MYALAKIVAIVLVAIVALALTANASGRELLQYDGCYNGWRGWDWNRGDYYCGGHRWRRDGGWWNGNGWAYGSGGFCLGVCG